MKQDAAPSRAIAEAARNQFDSSFYMLEKLVDVCPDTVWYAYFNDDPFWYHIYHVAYFIDYWIRKEYINENFRSMLFDESIPPEFEHDVDRNITISRSDMKEYLKRIKAKTVNVFDSLDDGKMALPIINEQTSFTYMDVITAQIRHIMYNIGYLNGILRSKGLAESDWYAYNEVDE
jgi:hypothetical protein